MLETLIETLNLALPDPLIDFPEVRYRLERVGSALEITVGTELRCDRGELESALSL